MPEHPRTGYTKADGTPVRATTVHTKGPAAPGRVGPGQLDRVRALGALDGVVVSEEAEANDEWGSLAPEARAAALRGMATPSDEDILELAVENGLSADDLADVVLDVKGDEAANVNNSGYEEQLRYLGRDPGEIDQYDTRSGEGVEELDDAVHDAKADEAAAISEEGLRAQVDYLVERLGEAEAHRRVAEVVAAKTGSALPDPEVVSIDASSLMSADTLAAWHRALSLPPGESDQAVAAGTEMAARLGPEFSVDVASTGTHSVPVLAMARTRIEAPLDDPLQGISDEQLRAMLTDQLRSVSAPREAASQLASVEAALAFHAEMERRHPGQQDLGALAQQVWDSEARERAATGGGELVEVDAGTPEAAAADYAERHGGAYTIAGHGDHVSDKIMEPSCALCQSRHTEDRSPRGLSRRFAESAVNQRAGLSGYYDGRTAAWVLAQMADGNMGEALGEALVPGSRPVEYTAVLSRGEEERHLTGDAEIISTGVRAAAEGWSVKVAVRPAGSSDHQPEEGQTHPILENSDKDPKVLRYVLPTHPRQR